MKTSIQPAALADLRRGFHFYERQEAGLGTYFLDSLYSDIDSLRLFAGIHTIHFGKFYRLLSKRFPFAVYYGGEGEYGLRPGGAGPPSRPRLDRRKT